MAASAPTVWLGDMAWLISIALATVIPHLIIGNRYKTLPDATVPLAGFGTSDCSCESRVFLASPVRRGGYRDVLGPQMLPASPVETVPDFFERGMCSQVVDVPVRSG
jgi:hypothetical protein